MAIINNNPDLLVPDLLVDPTPTTANFCYIYKPGFNSVAIAFTFTKVDDDDMREVVTFSTAVRLSGARGGGQTFKESVPGPTDVMARRSYVERKPGSYFFTLPQTQPGETIISVEIADDRSDVTLEVMQNPGIDYFSNLYSIAGKQKSFELTNGNIVTALLANGGSANMNIDASTVPAEFVYSVPSGKIFMMSGLTMLVSTNVNIPGAFGYFSHIPALTNGIQIITDGNAPSFVFRENSEIGLFSESVENGGPFGKDGKLFTARLDYARITCGNCATIYDTVKAIINDDLSGLSGLSIAVKGYLV